MNNSLIRVKALWLLLLLSIISCQRMYDEEEEENVPQTGFPLKVSARSSGDSQIGYPAYIYAFAEDGSCSANQKIKDNSQIEMKLSPGRYTLVAIANIGEEYVIPEDPFLDDVIVMKANNRSLRALMMGSSTVTIDNKKNVSVSITLYYTVSLVNVTLEEIPATVKSVSLRISPLYSSLSFAGEYAGKDKSTEITCRKETEGTWSAEPFYIFPGSASQTVFSITLEDDNQTNTYGYTSKGKPEANVPMNIGGSYSGDVTVGGSLISGEWKEPVEIKFNFGGKDEGDIDGENPPATNPDLPGLPEVMSVWQDGIVAGIEIMDANGADVLLMSLNEWDSVVAKLQETIKNEEVNGWHLPNEEEAQMLYAAFKEPFLNEVNEALETSGGTSLSTKKRYVYDKNGSKYAFGFKSSSQFQPAGSTVKYGIRLVRSVRYQTNN